MSIQSVLLPVLLQVVLVFGLLGMMAKSRIDATKQGVRAADVAVSNDAWPTRAKQISNCYANQFEMPVLFLLAVILGIVVHQTGWLFVLLEWLFVACRFGHALVHTTSNDLTFRGPLFLGSAVATLLLWVLIFIGVFLGGFY